MGGRREYEGPASGMSPMWIDLVQEKTFILATGWNGSSPFPPFYEKAKAKGWKTRTMACGHDVMLDLPDKLTKVLVEGFKRTQCGLSEQSKMGKA
jgi:hypothetical protein